MVILGIDPGSVFCGYGLINKSGNNYSLIEYGVIKAKKINPDMPERMKEIYRRINQVIERNKPDAAVLETTFYSKNVQSLIKLSYARASAILAVSFQNIPIFEYSPREIKQSVTGRGNSSKEQVQYMVKNMLKIDETPELFDATDALAAALCYGFRSNTFKSKTKNWNDFIKQNPDRIVKI